MEVRNQPFLHILKIGGNSGDVRPGTVIATNRRTLNPFTQFYNHKSWTLPIPGQEEQLPLVAALERALQLSQDAQKGFCINNLQAIKDAAKEQASFIRDVIFEEVRSLYFPHLPSRFSCLWLCEATALEYWWSKLASPNPRIVEVAATGIIHRGDDRHLVSDSVPHNELRRIALLYWTGADGTRSQEEEILFEGTLKIEKVFMDISKYRNNLT